VGLPSGISERGWEGGLPEEEFALFAHDKVGERGEGYLRRNSPFSPLAKVESYLRRNSPSSPLERWDGYMRRNLPSSLLAKMGGLHEEEFALFTPGKGGRVT
jgi:hypothetical protein